MEHTKGEWIIKFDRESKLPIDVGTKSCQVCFFSEKQYLQTRKLRANASLIAAAPDLLEVCKNLQSLLNQDSFLLMLDLKEAVLLRKAETAIAKATKK